MVAEEAQECDEVAAEHKWEVVAESLQQRRDYELALECKQVDYAPG